MNGSPRRSLGRSVGPMTSPSRNANNGTPSHAPVNRTLDFSVNKKQTTASLAKHKPSKPVNGVKKGKKKGPFNLSISDDEEQESVDDSINPSLINNNNEDIYAPPIDDDPVDQENTMQSIEGDEPPFAPTEAPMQDEDASAGAMAPPLPKKKRGRRPSKIPAAPVANMDESQISLSGPVAPKRGRPSKKAKIFQDTNTAQEEPSNPTQGETRKQAPKERDPNARPKAAKANGKPPSRASSVVSRAGGYTVQRSETPATDGGAFTTRSGRTSIKPLASWRGEKAIFGQRPSTDSLPGIQEVVRTEEVMPPPRRRVAGYRPGKRRPKSQVLEEIVEEDEEEELEPWEAETGIQHAMVMQWNPDTGKYDEDNTEQLGTTPSFSKH